MFILQYGNPKNAVLGQLADIEISNMKCTKIGKYQKNL